MFNLLVELSHGHEVRQFSQPQLHEVVRSDFIADVWPTTDYREHQAAATSPRPPRSSETALGSGPGRSSAVPAWGATRPRLLREWLAWADVALVEFPWQFAYCRRAAPALAIVFASQNVEILTRTSNARAAHFPSSGAPPFASLAGSSRTRSSAPT